MGWFKFDAFSGRQSALAESSLFSGLTGRELKIVQGFLHERTFLAQEVVFDEGEEGQALYIILSGQIRICPQGQRDSPVARLGVGDFFGEMALIDDHPRSAQAVADEDTRLAILYRGDLERLMSAHALIASRVALQLARHLGGRLRELLGRERPTKLGNDTP